MMTKSRRAKRMERYIARNRKSPLNLISLMDIFTILVFFLLVSSASVQQLPNKKDIKLPTSIAKKVPEETLTISVTSTKILVQGRQVALVEASLANSKLLIGGLEDELKFQYSKSPDIRTADGKIQGKAITILGDENIPYELLKKILATCQQANYTQIAFAALQKTAGGNKI